jgi:hypothetical protein
MINLGFLLRENLAAIFITPSSWGSQRAGHLPGIKQYFLAPLPGTEEEEEAPSSTRHQLFSGAVAGKEKEDFCEGSFSHAHPLFCLLFCFTLFIFTCIILSKTKKIRILGSCYFFTLVHYVVP